MRSLSWSLLVLLAPSPALAATLTVGAGKTYADPCAAIAAASAGDTIEVDPGTYTVACKVGKSLTVRGVGAARAVLKAPSSISNGKGILAVEGGEVDFVAEHLEFTGAAVGDQNGAGIRFQGRDLTVRDCAFHDNQNGILTAPQRDVVIESSEFYDNGAGDGQSHNMYIGNAETFTFRASWSHGSKTGHLLKSRAKKNLIVASRLTDETTTPSDNVELPNGGASYLIGNLFEQANGDAGNMIRIGMEGNKYGDVSQLVLVHNTFVNHRNKGAYVLVNSSVTQPTVIANNLFFGQGNLPSDKVTSVGNLMRELSAVGSDLVSDAGYDYHLKAGAPAIDKGVDVSAYLGGAALEQYVHPLGVAPRTAQGSAPDVGAYEFGDTGEGGQGGAAGSSGQGGQGGAAAGEGGQGGAAAGEGGQGGAAAGAAGQGGASAGSSAEGGQGGASAGAAGQGGQGGGQAGAGTSGQGGAAAGTAGAGGQAGAAAGTAGQGGAAAGKAGAAGTAGAGGAKAGAAGSVSGASGQEPESDSGDDGGCQASAGAPGGWGAGALALVAGLSLGRRRRRAGR